MDLILSKCNDARNVIGKTLADSVTFDITLRGDFNITAPEIALEMPAGTDPLTLNYAEIPELSRRYFVERVESINAKVWRFTMVCDVLETYKAEILESEGNYRRKVQAGDYGDVALSETGRTEALTHSSAVTLEPDNKAILSVMGGYYG